MVRQIGDRIGAILGTDGNVINFLGYGTYQGWTVPPKEAGGLGFPNPTMLLDNGDTVYGFECWWGSEEKISNHIELASEAGGYAVKDVRIAEYREVAS